jgi:peptidylprolyl isomerase
MKYKFLTILYLSLSVLAIAKTDKLFGNGIFSANQKGKPESVKKPVKKSPASNKTISYKILKTNSEDRAVKSGELLMIHLFGTGKLTDNRDTIIFNSYAAGKPFFIPADEPTLGKVFLNLRKNDSLEIDALADTLFLNSFKQPTPPFLKQNSYIHFLVKVENVYNQQEIEVLKQAELIKKASKDSAEINALLAKYKDIKTTASGLKYVITKSTTGSYPQKGDEVQMNYTGMFLDGKKFDENLNTESPFSFKLGTGQVIAGWDEGILLLHEGEEAMLIIPSDLGYGEQGTGPIPPNTTLVFDVKLLKIKPNTK